jgi:hypothetical protein
LKLLILKPDSVCEALDERESLTVRFYAANLLSIVYNTIFNLYEALGHIYAHSEDPRRLDGFSIKTHRKDLGLIRLGLIHDDGALLLTEDKQTLFALIGSYEGYIFVGLDARIITLCLVCDGWGSQNIRVRIWYCANPITLGRVRVEKTGLLRMRSR